MTAPARAVSALADQIRELLGQAEEGSVVAWWGTTELPDGSVRVPPLSQPAFEGVYFLLENAGVGRGAVRPLAAVQAATRDLGAGDPVPIAIASYAMSVPRPDVAQRVREAAAAGAALDPAPASLEEATEPRRFFAASALLADQWKRPAPVHRGRAVRFVVDERFHLTHAAGAAPDSVEADLGDGRGFAPVTWGEPFGTTYPAAAQAATVAVRCTYGGERLEAKFVMPIADGPLPPAPDEVWPLVGGESTGRAYVYRGAGHAAVINPVILVEGFPGMHPRDYLYELFDQAGTVEAMRARGYDVILVGLDNGMDVVQRNAPVLEDCIRHARERTSAPLVVGGVSMGGIVARLALAQMEARGDDHRARLYVSIDSPHRGAYTSLGAQWFVHSMKGAMPGLHGFAHLIDSPSNQQMMAAWLHDGVAGTSPLREELLADLDAAGGYPQKPRRIAVSCGRGDGVGHAPPGALTLSWAGEPFVSAVLRTLPGESRSGPVASGSWFLAEPPEFPPLDVEGMPAWEGSPGGQATYNGQVAAIAKGIGCGEVTHDLDISCSVPTVSALDLDQDPFAPVAPAGDGPFHAHVCSAANELHLTITPEVSNWLLSELGDPPMQTAATPAAATTPAPTPFNAHDPRYLADPYPTYARFREHAPVHCVRPYNSHWVFRHEDVHAVLDDTATFVKKSPTPGPPRQGPIQMMDALGPGLFGSDPPRHTDLRAILGPIFHEAIADADQMAAALSAATLQRLAPRGRFELVTDFALPVPANVLFSILGIPEDKLIRMGLLHWQAQIVAAHDKTAPIQVKMAGATAQMALLTFLAGYVAMAQATPQPGVIGGMCRKIGDGLSATDVQLCAADFIIAGYLSTTYLIASGIRLLDAHPEQLAALRDDPDGLMAGAVREMLRYDAPAQLVDRVAAQDTEIAGVPIQAGEKVCCVLGSADHDPEAFDDPDEFRINRDGGHISFGAGIHECIGAPLVGLMAVPAMKALLALPGLSVDGTPQWQSDPYLRGMLNLPVRVG